MQPSDPVPKYPVSYVATFPIGESRCWAEQSHTQVKLALQAAIPLSPRLEVNDPGQKRPAILSHPLLLLSNPPRTNTTQIGVVENQDQIGESVLWN